MIVGLLALGLFFFLSASVNAQTTQPNFGPNPNTYGQYGHAQNGYTGTEPYQADGGFCGATAIANSLQFLANKYGGAYEGLLQAPPVYDPRTAAQATRDAIVDLEDVYADGSGPINQATQWNAKVSYINNQINPNQIKIEGMEDGSIFGDTGYDTPANTSLNLTSGPSEEWLQQQIAAGQDVEIGFTYSVLEPIDAQLSKLTSYAHMVTLANIDSAGMYIQYLDPNAPGGFITAPFTLQTTTGYLSFNWNNGIDPPAFATIDLGWSESVPEPATARLLLLGAGLLGLHRSRRQAA
jgi:hypothetical protein